jgi:hypothetical protein
MKLTNRKIWCLGFLGILAAVVLVAFVWYRMTSDDLVVQFVDKAAGKPMGNLKVTIEESEYIPVLYRCDFLPWSMRHRSSSRTIKSGDNGCFHIRRIVGTNEFPLTHIVVEVDRGRTFDFSYVAGNFYALPWIGSHRYPSTLFIRVIPVLKEGTLVIPLDPAWMQ